MNELNSNLWYIPSCGIAARKLNHQFVSMTGDSRQLERLENVLSQIFTNCNKESETNLNDDSNDKYLAAFKLKLNISLKIC